MVAENKEERQFQLLGHSSKLKFDIFRLGDIAADQHGIESLLAQRIQPGLPSRERHVVEMEVTGPSESHPSFPVTWG